MKKITKQNEEKAIEQTKTIKDLHEAELESVAGALAPGGCFHFKNSAKSWGF